MKKILLATTFLVLVGVSLSNEVQAVTSQVPTTAEIIAPLTVDNWRGLVFGKIARQVGDASVRTVRLDPVQLYAPGVSGDCGTTITCIGPGEAAGFNVTGLQNAAYSITLPASTTITNGANSLTVQDFTYWAAGNSTLFNPGGSGYFYVGGSLLVPANVVPGQYTGTFPVTVNYN